MPIQRLTIDGYGQLELNNAAFRRDGRVEAQCPLDATDFADVVAENGMLLVVNKIQNKVFLPKTAALDAPGALVALHYSAEHLYDASKMGLKNFYLTKDSVLPRLGYLATGDKICTNTVCYDTTDFADDDALKNAIADVATTPIYGCEHESGAILLSKTAPTDAKVVFVVTKGFSMPDGQYGIKMQVVEVA